MADGSSVACRRLKTSNFPDSFSENARVRLKSRMTVAVAAVGVDTEGVRFQRRSGTESRPGLRELRW